MILAVVSSKITARVGLPVLVVFLGLGMLAGAEGPGGIVFDNYEIAHAIGTVALALILFDGGLGTPGESLRVAWKPAGLLATLGVLFTALVTGVVASYILDLTLVEGLLLGAIVGSTDAAAVFSLLRSSGIHLRKRLAATLEIESGANDPMAIFLTIGLIEVLLGERPLGAGMLTLFALQMGVGLVVGLAVGKLAVKLINRLNLAAAGLYPVLTASCGILAFGLAAVVGGSGFLAIYVAGLVLGNSKLAFQRGTLLFHDGLAWTSQIVMFVVLGLLSTPSYLFAVGGQALAIAAALILLARPLAVVPLLLPFRYSWREHVLVSWVGLKGAVPIILATYPLMFGLEAGPMIFNVVFFVVILSAVVQGGTLASAARLLKLEEPAQAAPPISLELTSLREIDADILDYPVDDESRAADRLLRDLALPSGSSVAMIVRDNALIPPRGSTRVLAGDHLYIVVDRESRAAVDRVFARGRAESTPLLAEFPLPGTATAGQLTALYDIETGEPPDVTLEELIRNRVPDAQVETSITLGQAKLRVREIQDGRITMVGLGLAEDAEPQAPTRR